MNTESPDPQAPDTADFATAGGAILRLLDANSNRAREALRVLEDYTRFVLDDGPLSGRLKSIRHGLAGALGPVLPVAILHRDTPGDVGTANKTAAEFNRAGVDDVVTAAGKRLGEALRAIEEYLKTLDPSAAAAVETLRYDFYDVEQRIARTLHPPATDFSAVELYVLVTESVCNGDWLEAAEDAVAGGADCLQLREKSLESGELLRRAKSLVELCRSYGIPCIINDRPDIAVLAGADGVHVGQGDLPAVEARKIVGPSRIVGVSTHQIGQARQAVLDGANYIGVGPFFRSSTKPRDFLAGPDYATEVAKEIGIPAIAIAGITADNVDQVLATGVRAVAVSSAVLGAADVKRATVELKARLSGGGGRMTREKVSRIGGQAFLPVTRAGDESSTTHPRRGTRPKPAEPGVTFTRRHLPHLQRPHASYFLTFRLVVDDLDRAERKLVLDHLRSGDGKFYRLLCAVIMPDHAHLILQPADGYSLDRILKGIKGVTARLLNRRRNRDGKVWQDESWDRIIRDRDELADMMTYVLDNPVRKQLVVNGRDWDAWHFQVT